MNSCGKCKFARIQMKSSGPVNMAQRLCTRFPPTAQVVLVPSGGSLQVNNMNFFPTVDADDQGCGEYIEKISLV